MKPSELIAAYGDGIEFQSLDLCVEDFNKIKHGTRVTFVTEHPSSPDGFTKLGLVLWLDRRRVAQIIDGNKSGE